MPESFICCIGLVGNDLSSGFAASCCLFFGAPFCISEAFFCYSPSPKKPLLPCFDICGHAFCFYYDLQQFAVHHKWEIGLLHIYTSSFLICHSGRVKFYQTILMHLEGSTCRAGMSNGLWGIFLWPTMLPTAEGYGYVGLKATPTHLFSSKVRAVLMRWYAWSCPFYQTTCVLIEFDKPADCVGFLQPFSLFDSFISIKILL